MLVGTLGPDHGFTDVGGASLGATESTEVVSYDGCQTTSYTNARDRDVDAFKDIA